MSQCHPGVESIIVVMNYYHGGSEQAIMQRTVNFCSGSATYFKMECMNHDCVDGGFNLEPVIVSMIKDRLKSGKGELSCKGKDAVAHARIDYKISVKYKRASR